MNDLKPRMKSLRAASTLLCTGIIVLMLCVSGCATQSPTIEYPLPPLPDYRVLDELDAHGMTPEAAPHTWAFFGKVFMYYDVVGALRN